MQKPKKNAGGRPPKPKEHVEKRKVGRPMTYDPKYHLKKASYLAWLGNTNEQIAKIWDISFQTLYEWIAKFPELGEAIYKGRHEVMEGLTNSLTRRARGYKVKEVKKTITPAHQKLVEEFEFDPEFPNDMAKAKLVSKLVDVPEIITEVVETLKEVPPDVSALKYIHNNRQSDKWRESQHIDHTTNGKDVGTGMDLSLLTDEEVATLAALEAKARKAE